ncbi:MAG: carbohydrate-binding family 9-like protein, partial [Victivallaceae bacterium]|nr:carbohydrate-binding family 9-like protein [Victivallaceae bacterium]
MQKSSRMIAVILILLSGGFTNSLFSDEVNLFSNPGFEFDKNNDGVPDGWKLMKVNNPGKEFDAEIRSSNIANSGKHSLYIKSKNNYGYGSVFQAPVYLAPNSTYKFSCWLKTKGLTIANCPYVNCWDSASKKRIAGYSGIQVANNIKDWWYFESVFSTPDTPSKIQATFHLFLFKLQGEVWIDDVSLTLVPGKPLLTPLKTVNCPITKTPPTIDGRLTDPCWEKAAIINDFKTTANTIPRENTVAYACYDNNNLYLGFKCFESQINKLHKKPRNYDDNGVWQDDCVEIFIDADNDYSTYYHFMVNCLGSRADEKAWGRAQIKCDSGWNADWQAKSHIDRNFWSAEIAIPFSELKIVSRRVPVRLNLCRENKITKENCLWAPAVSFHDVQAFGSLVLNSADASPISILSFFISKDGKICLGDNSLSAQIANRTKNSLDLKAELKIIPFNDKACVSALSLSTKPESKQEIKLPYKLRGGRENIVFTISDTKTGEVYFFKNYLANLRSSKISGYVLSSNSDYTLWYADPTSKIMKNTPLPTEKKKGIAVSLAKNEYEPFQLVISSLQDISEIEIKTSPLIGPSGAQLEAPKINMVDYIKIKQPSDSLGYADDWPDPLPPYKPFSVKTKQNQPVWLTVYASKENPAGIYKGKIELKIKDKTVSIPLEATVYDFTLPKEPHLRTSYGHTPAHAARWTGVTGNIELCRKYNDVINENFRSHRVSKYHPMVWSPITYEVKNPGSDNPEVKVDFSVFDQAAERYLNEFGFNSFNLLETWGIYYENGNSIYGPPYYPAVGGIPEKLYGYPRFSPQFNKIYIKIGNIVTEHIKEKGWLDKAYIFWTDEPTKERYSFVRQGMDLLKRAYPGVKRLETLSKIQPEL